MYCIKKERRNVFTLLKEYDCKNCPNFLNDEIIKIGNNTIKIFYLINECKFNNHNVVGNNLKVNLIFKDIYIDYIKDFRSKNIFLWLNKSDNLNKYYLELNYFLNNDFNVYIII